MSRPLQAGDRVTATGTVQRVTSTLLDPSIKVAIVAFDGDDYQTHEGTPVDVNALTLITPAEPPVGSVVVKDGVAFTRSDESKTDLCWCDPTDRSWWAWGSISDGEVIFPKGWAHGPAS